MWGLGRDLGGDVDGRAGVDVGTVQSLSRRGSSWRLAPAFPVHLRGGSRGKVWDWDGDVVDHSGS